MPKVVPSAPEIDKSLQSWLYNIRHVLNFPITVLGVAGLLVAGTFAETAPRKSLKFLDNIIGRALFFLIPLYVAYGLDWATGLLAAVVALIFFARLQVDDDIKEGFLDEMTTEIIPTSRRWFVEKVLGETPIAISSDRIRRVGTEDEDSRTSSSSSMATTGTSDGNSNK